MYSLKPKAYKKKDGPVLLNQQFEKKQEVAARRTFSWCIAAREEKDCQYLTMPHNLRRFLCWIFLKSLEDSRALLFTSCLSTVRQPSFVKEHPKFKLRSSPGSGSWCFPGFSQESITCPLQKKIHSYGRNSQQKRPKNQPLGAATFHQVIRRRGFDAFILTFFHGEKSSHENFTPKMTPYHFRTNAGPIKYGHI